MPNIEGPGGHSFEEPDHNKFRDNNEISGSGGGLEGFDPRRDMPSDQEPKNQSSSSSGDAGDSTGGNPVDNPDAYLAQLQQDLWGGKDDKALEAEARAEMAEDLDDQIRGTDGYYRRDPTSDTTSASAQGDSLPDLKGEPTSKEDFWSFMEKSYDNPTGVGPRPEDLYKGTMSGDEYRRLEGLDKEAAYTPPEWEMAAKDPELFYQKATWHEPTAKEREQGAEVSHDQAAIQAMAHQWMKDFQKLGDNTSKQLEAANQENGNNAPVGDTNAQLKQIEAQLEATDPVLADQLKFFNLEGEPEPHEGSAEAQKTRVAVDQAAQEAVDQANQTTADAMNKVANGVGQQVGEAADELRKMREEGANAQPADHDGFWAFARQQFKYDLFNRAFEAPGQLVGVMQGGIEEAIRATS
ncbi:MAG: hypothetical protein J2P37_32985 [Ktedonobacteraceae bacterium]|nr:hypothetical protein [Ktedonobacteraceae bacterium]